MINFQDYLQTQTDFTSPRLILVEGGVDPATGINWCPDCIDAEENVNNILIPVAKGKNLPVDIVEVGSRDSWKNPQHPLRVHNIIKIARVPTLVFIKDNKTVRTLVELDIVNKELLYAFLEDL